MSNNGTEQGSVEGVIRIEGGGQLPREFITVGNSFREALGKCTILDLAQRNAIIVYKAQLDIFNMKDEISDLTDWLNSSNAVGGINKSIAAMTEVGIYMPEGAGINLDKDTRKALMEMQRMRSENRNENDRKDEGNKRTN